VTIPTDTPTSHLWPAVSSEVGLLIRAILRVNELTPWCAEDAALKACDIDLAKTDFVNLSGHVPIGV